MAQRLFALWARLLAFIKENLPPQEEAPLPVKTTPPMPPQDPTPTPPQNPPVEELLWDTPEHARHSARVIMDTYGLRWAEKNLLCAVIQAESAFNIHAVNRNTNGSCDYGIVQMNDEYWIGPGKYFTSKEEVFNKPEKSIKFMVEAYLNHHLGWWYGFTNGNYKRYLK